MSVPKKTTEVHNHLLDEIHLFFTETSGDTEVDDSLKERLLNDFSYVEVGETLPISKGGFQNTVVFGMQDSLSFALVSKLEVSEDKTKEEEAVLTMYVAIRKAGRWRDYYDVMLLPDYMDEAKIIREHTEQLVEKIEGLIKQKHGKVVLIDETNRPLRNMKKLQANKDEMRRCKNLFLHLET